LTSLASCLVQTYDRAALGMRLGLQAMEHACAMAGHPERAFRAVHVTGTNGKGSVCAMVEAIARRHGLKTGLYTSPHLCRFAERIRIDGRPLEDDRLAEHLARALAIDPPLSFFETATLAAWLAFRELGVDVGIVEVGIGGRLDATNVLPGPVAAAITRVALDHADRLGPTILDIAREKAGIAKPGLDLVLGPMDENVRAVIEAVARERGATTSSTQGVSPPPIIGIAGEHQRDNARIATVLGTRLGASPGEIAEAIAEVRWPGRLESIGAFLLDGAHNPDGALSLASHLRSLRIPAGDTGLVFGALEDKDWGAMLEVLAPLAAMRIYVEPQSGSRPSASPASMAARFGGQVVSSVENAVDVARTLSPRLTVVAGSLALVGRARAFLMNLPTDPSVSL
jgi:dihydrofolate synthase/folylpolyglutamate synthase